jgi:Cyanate permease
MKLLYKLSKSVIPCVLLTLCIGFCYAWSLFTPHIAEAIGCSVKSAQFTFCLNIFFLGMGAATFGPLVEKRIGLAATVSATLLVVGLALGGLACQLKNIWLMYLGCGFFAGTAEGCGYVTPNKNMILWFPATKHKGILSAISIFTFGLGSAVCSWLFGTLFPKAGISGMFYSLAAIYSVPAFLSAFLINKPKYALLKLKRQKKSPFSYIDTLKSGFFGKTWLFMFLNISMGLILIGSCASVLREMGLSGEAVITVMMLCGIFNGVGRLVFPAVSDFLKNRSKITVSIVAFEILLMAPILLSFGIGWMAVPAAIAVILVHSGYGAAFAVLPSVLESRYGKDTLSQRHGFCLTSWGMASLMAYLCSTFVLGRFSGFFPVMVLILCGYAANLLVSLLIAGDSARNTEKFSTAQRLKTVEIEGG